MLSDFQKDHLLKRLRLIHAAGLAMVSVFFLLFYLLNAYTDVKTVDLQLVIVFMGILISLGYLSVLATPTRVPQTPLTVFFLLNLLTSVLVWLSGSFRSPFIALYIILILITAQLYHYRYGLLQAVLAFTGLAFVYTATTYLLIPYHSLIPYSDIWALYQPPWLVVTYACIYGILFVFAGLSASSARVILFRPTRSGDLESTYQEQIIQKMPLGIFIVDDALHILSSNHAAAQAFPITSRSNKLTNYLSLAKEHPEKTLYRLSKSGQSKTLTWRLDTGEIVPITISVERHESSKKDDCTYIMFVR